MEYIIFIVFLIIYLAIGGFHAVIIFNNKDEGLSSAFATFIVVGWPIICIVCVFVVPIIVVIKYLKEG